VFSGPDADHVFLRSQARWQAALRAAKSLRPGQFPQHVFNLSTLLLRIPALPDDIPSDQTSLEGYSTWANSDPSCPLREITEPPHRLCLRSSNPIKFSVSTYSNFNVWEGTQNNGVALLVLGWAYVLNASMAERQHLRLRNVRLSKDPSAYSPSCSTALDLGYAESEELAWWKVITSRGTAFRIDGETRYLNWSVEIEDLGGIHIVGPLDTNIDDTHHLPTAAQAATYLARFSAAYSLGNQCSAALVAALSFRCLRDRRPRFNRVSLPQLRLQSAYDASAIAVSCQPPPDFENLSYYMTLGSSIDTLSAVVQSTFWEPDVPCNLAGASLRPIRHVLVPILEAKNYELLVKVVSFTKAAPLWLGFSLCGRHYPVLTTLDQCLWPAMHALDAAAWTGIAQSFMDIQRPGPYLRNGKVTRADVWRLRHDCHAAYENQYENYSREPLNPWHPFGGMRLEDVEMEIHDHLLCSHQWTYRHWTWLSNLATDAGFFPEGRPSCSNGTWVEEEPGLEDTFDSQNRGTISRADRCAIRDISRRTTEAIFRFCSHQVEEKIAGNIIPRVTLPDIPLLSSDNETNVVDENRIYEWLFSLQSGT